MSGVTKNYFMINLLGSMYEADTDIYTFFFHNTESNWYYQMTCRNSFGTSDMEARSKDMSYDEFYALAGERLA